MNDTEFDYLKLKLRIIEKYGTQTNFCKICKLSSTTISKKMNNKESWKAADIIKVCELLEIPLNEAHLYFFKEKVKVS